MPIRVVVAEDNYLVREAVTRLLDSDDDIEVVGACEDLDSLLAFVREHEPDVVVTDIRMPPTGTDEGVRAAKLLRASHPGVGVVVLSQYVEPSYALELLDEGSERRRVPAEGAHLRRRSARASHPRSSRRAAR